MLLENGGILTLKGCYDYKDPVYFCSRQHPDDRVACCFEDSCNMDPSFEPVLECCEDTISAVPTSPAPDRPGKASLAAYIVGPVLGPALFVVFAAVAISVTSLLCAKYHRKPRKSSSKNFSVSIHHNAATHSPDDGILPLMMQRGFVCAIKQEYFSSGYFGRHVLVGEYQNKKIPLKMIPNCSREKLWSRELEMYNTATLHHNNVLLLFAGDTFSDKGATELWLMTHGSLDGYLSREAWLTSAVTLRMAVSIAKGLAYLHSGAKPSVVHRNRCIVVKDSLECYIGDLSCPSMCLRNAVPRAELSEILVDQERFEVLVHMDVSALVREMCSRSQVVDGKCAWPF